MAGDDSQERVAIAALVIAIAALLAAELQILQAIFASARGLPNCNEVVMGGWSKGTKIRPKFKHLRLEVRFEAPIIFLAPPKNKRKPEPGEMWSAEGTEASCKKNRLDYAKLFSSSGSEGMNSSVHTVDMELATWVYLLIAIETMEKVSKDWENRTVMGYLPEPTFAATVRGEPTLAVKIQAKERSFDTVPAMKKPFATTTISHIVELAAILGIYWKVFDRDNNQYRAEGNGYSLTGSRIPDLGIQFVFEKTGQTAFEARRVIPTSEIKELCFGRVPTLFRNKINADEDLEWQNPLMTSSGTGIRLEILQMGSTKEIAETLTQIGCNGSTTLYYTEGKKHRHLFPVTFEVLGMLARVLHIDKRCFRFLPNPTIFPWDRESFSLPRLLTAFSSFISDDLKGIKEVKTVPDSSLESGILTAIPDIQVLSDSAKALHDAVKNYPKLTHDQMTSLHQAIAMADGMLKEEDIVLDVMRRHLQHVLAAINNPVSGDEVQVSFDHLLDIPLEMREWRFMETYFDSILWRATSSAKNSKRDDEVVSQAIHEDTEIRQLHNEGDQSPFAPKSGTSPNIDGSQTEPMPPTPGISRRESWPPRVETGKHERLGASKVRAICKQRIWTMIASEHVEMRRVAIWYTLVFRMICWLMLHDFDKKDLQLSKSELIGNRQTVFIV
ncbi:modin [Colletotrichum graminicola]|uniref:Modin n=1 Tax=Colletotrichum graminicola (strain M1.001 / M2 / FGSC 10212) TaxID=645133 RepID=E3QUH2_COLGM|nr:modin [Colletotrichum graminicola M1.001]EFQ34510.1 modin [Colletotrichum graminicola M1.001]WDK22588.1 modin [Colletotrichum graminicola]